MVRKFDRASRGDPEAFDIAVEEAAGVARDLEPAALDRLVDDLRDRSFVLIGEASHGTSEFYRWRARLTARLVETGDFDFVAVEGDWTDCYEVNRYVKGLPQATETVRDVLDTFTRWPTWMWANWEVLEFLEWLTIHNESVPNGDRVGFFGLDVYSLYESLAAVVEYLEEVDPDAADEARAAYRCFEPFGADAQEYARALRMVPESCEDEVVELLSALRAHEPEYDHHEDDYFNAEQNALVARNAEQYYRQMVRGETDSWNIRDRHMLQTLERLEGHHGPDAAGIVWAHNTHVGDARATDMVDRGRINIGQLVRERFGASDTALVGMGTYRGTVIAADAWEAPMAERHVPPAREGSLEHVCSEAGDGDWYLLCGDVASDGALAEPRGHRAIGVVYHPERESGNYVPTVLPERYDLYLHLEETSALHPLEVHVDRTAIPELYPWGL